MAKTKFLVLSDDSIKGYELIFKPSLKSYSWKDGGGFVAKSALFEKSKKTPLNYIRFER